MESYKKPQNTTNWFEQNPKKSLFLFYLFFLLVIELILRVLAYQGVFPIVYYPTTSSMEGVYRGDINEHFGVWRHPGRSAIHRSPCFNVEYTSNSWGARDKERTLKAGESSRVVVLGDSFVEGTGVSVEERVTDVAERKSGVEFLNFGIAGDFSSTQEWLLYKELASKFDHDEVVLFFLPDNDFVDNDPEEFSSDRYRPYLRKNDSGEFEVYYTVPFEQRAKSKEVNGFRRIRRHFYNNVYLLNVIRTLGSIIENSVLGDFVDRKYDNRISYDDFTELDFERLTYGYTRIAELAAPLNLTIFIIPRKADLDSWAAGENRLEVVRRLKEFAAGNERIVIHDLLPDYVSYAKEHSREFDDFYHLCDGHWSALGNQVAADVLLSRVGVP